MIKIIVACDKNGLIGDKGKIPWKIPEEMKFFKETTWGHTVIMGRLTWESISEKFRPLPGRENIVLTSSKIDGVLTAKSLEEAIKMASHEVFIIGGAKVYKEALKYADRIIVSFVEGEYTGDTYFPVCNVNNAPGKFRLFFKEFSVWEVFLKCPKCNKKPISLIFCDFCLDACENEEDVMFCENCILNCDFGHVCKEHYDKVMDGRINEHGVEVSNSRK